MKFCVFFSAKLEVQQNEASDRACRPVRGNFRGWWNARQQRRGMPVAPFALTFSFHLIGMNGQWTTYYDPFVLVYVRASFWAVWAIRVDNVVAVNVVWGQPSLDPRAYNLF
ncbi:hypothetical protein V6N13_112319 [Hibiscus sabdariffa]|uniref:Uncharacterized protein n=1 Tax=Hibiscus sabdariffa TaxID=183260 RepID=A0ABR2TMS7_9ROSI